MTIREYTVTIKGETPLLMHWDNLEGSEDLIAWRSDPENKKLTKAGDDRTPAWTWMNHTYNDDVRIVIPAENIQRAAMEGGALVSVGGGKKTFKSQSQSGMRIVEAAWPLMVRGNEIAWPPLAALASEARFGLHKAEARRCGFELFVKRAKIGQSKHVRVRPRFNEWSAAGTVQVWDDQLSERVLREILVNAGKYKGLGDWRPGSKTPGSFGIFSVNVRESA